ncbi:hypothetical protein AX15_006797 [Amanita polypyramis BW_CC]|nr:hypothetical protein AX15_006797 [Amanita polypyramis BW_CC]
MNYFDTYELSATQTPSQPQQSLNEEVADVIGQFGRLWGTFRKQSQTALEIARRDIGGVVGQAQKELSKLTTDDSSNQQPRADPTGSESEETPSTPTNHEAPPSASSIPDTESNPSPPTFLSRLQSVIPPNIASAVRSHLPETLKHASENLDFTQLQTNLMSELQRVQGLTRAQAEEYVHKSESLLREAVKEAGVVLREAVKIVPPEEVASSSSAGAIWDGTDMWMFPSVPDVDGSEGSAVRSKTDHSTQQATETQRAVATRAEALLRRLKHDPSIVRHDPESDDTLKDYFNDWLAQEVEIVEGGVGGPFWSQKTSVLLEEPIDGPALQETLRILVPSEMTTETFWKRFFFRVHQISHEEERRKALIEASAVETEEDFSWGEDEEDEGGSLTTISPKKPQLTVTRSSSREGSEASYDVVSNAASGHDEKGRGEEEEEESDWE